MHRLAFLLVPLLAAAAFFTTGCSSFREDARVARKRSLPPESIEGLWEGRWYLQKNPDHGGRLQCVMTRTGDQIYRASTRSQWWGIFTSAYDANLIVTPVASGTYLIQGGRDIWPFGAYSVTGRVDGQRFTATFSMADRPGVMELHRPGAGVGTGD